ncbi:hypothetical protein CMQ_3995 [Grosmannia clavigera kw1407]|uniref:Uncharacterized protein n=1 Tax=Grosmannia clavigera (strain kw1407 / UAMH 11150) TaxID=655863 RepID=F0XA85_GROCL|nr:uncharacterized protein CMQ_3995 [Grosmannia clavigera kw1407]EFX05926.1 hypothetical protein CMQ_3995 [Grosmannia clavigera kw1407]
MAPGQKLLVKEAAIEAKRGGERGITARSVKKVTAVSIHLLCIALALGLLGYRTNVEMRLGHHSEVQRIASLRLRCKRKLLQVPDRPSDWRPTYDLNGNNRP